jgi:hypothetical protein
MNSDYVKIFHCIFKISQSPYFLTYKMVYTEFVGITNPIEQSTSWEASCHSASQEIPGLLWNPRVHYRVHKSPHAVPILSQMQGCNNSTPSHTVSLRSILMLSSQVHLDLKITRHGNIPIFYVEYITRLYLFFCPNVHHVMAEVSLVLLPCVSI